MAVYLISYDLNRPGQRYPELEEALKQFRAIRVCESDWILASTHDIKTVYDSLAKFIDVNDRMFVAGIAPGQGYWTGGRLISTDQEVREVFARG